MKSLSGKLDQLGFSASLLCAVHCALMPFLITLLPLIGLEFLSSPWVEVSMVVLSIVVGCSSLIPSYRKYHQNVLPLTLLLAGFLLIFGTHFMQLHELEAVLVPMGGIAIAIAHYCNWKLKKKFDHDHPVA